MARETARLITCTDCKRMLFVDALNPLGKCACGRNNAPKTACHIDRRYGW